MITILIKRLSKFLSIRRPSGDESKRDKSGIIIPVKGNEPAIEKLANFCRSRSLLKSNTQLGISFESFLTDSNADIGEVFQQQIATDLGSLTEILPILYELYTQLIVEAHENDSDNATQTDSSNRLYASLKRHPE
ncbi:MAG: hypothetical protein WBJ10_14420 [Daejeonella sp.]|uniref:hypothetical protein n=1 Tax=Daejeonella sp. TaxID=2805397 RepID=UPI003C74C700